MSLEHDNDIFIPIPLRTGSADMPDWRLCLEYVKKNHSNSFSTTLEKVFEKMNHLHQKIVQVFRPASIRSNFSDTFVEEFAVPYCKLLVQAQGHFPLHSGRVSHELSFSWNDSFPTAPVPGSKKSAATSPVEMFETSNICSLDSNIELMSCVYNIAAGYSALAAHAASSGTADALKTAYSYFQNAAGFLEALESAISRVSSAEQKKTNDLQKASISQLKKYTLAQAHHCGYLSAKVNQKPDTLLSKLAVKAAELYEDVKIMKTPLGDSSVGESIATHVTATALVFRARSHIHLAQSSEKETEMGVAVAYHDEASDFLDRMPTTLSGDSKEWTLSVKAAARLAQARAIKANNTICRQPVPETVSSPPGIPTALGKPIAPPSTFLQLEEPRKETDPFFGIIPASAANPARKWRESSQEMMHRSMERAENTQKKVTAALEALGVETFLQSVADEGQPGRSKIPEYLRTALLSVRNGNESKVQLVEPILERVKICDKRAEALINLLDTAEKNLMNQKEVEAPYLEKYGEVIWRSEYPDPCSAQAPSSVYTSLLSLIEEQRKLVSNKLQSPMSLVKQILYDQAPNLSTIEMSFSDLEILVPTRRIDDRLKAICEGLRTLLAHRKATVESQTQASEEAMTVLQADTLMYELASSSKDHQKSVLSRETEKLKKALSAMDACNSEMEALLRKVEEKMSAAAELQSVDIHAQEAQTILNEIQDGLTKYSELQNHLSAIEEYGRRSMDRVLQVKTSVAAFLESQAKAASAAQIRLDEKLSAMVGGTNSSKKTIESERTSTYAPPGAHYDPSQVSQQSTMTSGAAFNSYSPNPAVMPPGSQYSPPPAGMQAMPFSQIPYATAPPGIPMNPQQQSQNPVYPYSSPSQGPYGYSAPTAPQPWQYQ